MLNCFDIFEINDLHLIFCKNKNKYSRLNCLIGRFGIYVFLDKETGEVLYVGESHNQDMKVRIKQNFTENDTGGTFRQSWMDKNNKSFKDFKIYLKNCTIKGISLSVEAKSKVLMAALEAIIILAIKPKYNK